MSDRLRNGMEVQSIGMIISMLGLAVASLSRAHGRYWCWETIRSNSDQREGAFDEWVMHLTALKTMIDQQGGVRFIQKDHQLAVWLML